MGWDLFATIISPRGSWGPARVSQQLPAQNYALQGITTVLEIKTSPAATGMVLKHCENPALPGGFRNNQDEREMCPGSAKHLFSWRSDPGSRQLPEILFLKESTPCTESYWVPQGPGAGTSWNRASGTAQAEPSYWEKSGFWDSMLVYSWPENPSKSFLFYSGGMTPQLPHQNCHLALGCLSAPLKNLIWFF